MNSTNNIVSQETINSILIEMLHGAKGAGSEVYAAGKAGIVNAVEFANKHAESTVHEFLRWHFYDAVISAAISAMVLLIFGYWIRCIYRYSDKCPDSEAPVVSFGLVVCVIVFVATLTNSFVPNVKRAVKVGVAPSVYLIEWTVDQVKQVKK